MKLFWVLVLALSLLTACGGGEPEEQDAAPESEVNQETGEGTASPPPSQEAEPDRNREALTAALDRLENQGIWPDGRPVEYAFLEGPTVTDRFAIADVDGDGKEELILSHEDDVSAALFTAVYGWDGASADLREELSASPGLTFYENGTVRAPWSHHQLPSAEEPYTLFRWNEAQDVYEPEYQVSSWNRELMEAQSFPEPYPQEADVSGSGSVYFLDRVGSSDLGVPVDVQEFRAFEQSWKGAELSLDWQEVSVTRPAAE